MKLSDLSGLEMALSDFERANEPFYLNFAFDFLDKPKVQFRIAILLKIK